MVSVHSVCPKSKRTKLSSLVQKISNYFRETKTHRGVCKNETEEMSLEEGKGGCGVKMAFYTAGPSGMKKEQTQQPGHG